MTDDAKVEAYTNFNTKLKALINDLLLAYPDVTEIKLLKAGFKVLKKVSKKKPQHVFNLLFAAPYKDKIESKDSAFFASNEFSMEYLSNLKNVWINMDEVNRNHVWNHLIGLMAQNEICNKFHKHGPLVDSSDEEL